MACRLADLTTWLAVWRITPHGLPFGGSHHTPCRLVTLSFILAAILTAGCQKAPARHSDQMQSPLADHSVKRGDRTSAENDPATAPDTPANAIARGKALEQQALDAVNREPLLRAAIRAYAHAQWLDPKNGQATLNIARCHGCLGELQRAADILIELGRTHPSPTIHRRLAAVYLAGGRHQAALVEYRHLLKLNPEDLLAHNACGDIHLALSGQPGPHQILAREAALAHFRKSLQIDPDQPHVRTTVRRMDLPKSPIASNTNDDLE